MPGLRASDMSAGAESPPVPPALLPRRAAADSRA